MELVLLFPSFTVIAILAIIITFSLRFYFQHQKENRSRLMNKSPPDAAGFWPIIGHLPLLWGPELHHIILSNMADKHGPVFNIRLGVHRCLIVSSWEIAKECLTTNDLIFSNRPKTAALEHMTYNYAMFGFGAYSPYWREMRKISLLKLLSKHKVAQIGNLCVEEIRARMKLLYGACVPNGGKCEMKEFFGDLAFNLMVRIVAGDAGNRTIDERRRQKWREAINDFFKMMAFLTISDVLPFLKWSDSFVGANKAFEKTGKVLDGMLQSWLENCKKNKKNITCGSDYKEKGFMAEMMDSAASVAQELPGAGYDADTINKATCQTMMVGGTDPIAVTLTWALSLLLNNPHALKRAQQELDTHIGRQRHIQESDMQNLLYIKAIIKETLRLYPPAPLSPAREAATHCTLAGHHVAAGTRLIINMWKLHRDPNVWSDPLEFQPERFLTKCKEVDVRGQHFELLPFGGGRRGCGGVTFAVQTAEIALASFLHEFEIEKMLDEEVDMTGSMGTANVKAKPLEVILKPRLSSMVLA